MVLFFFFFCIVSAQQPPPLLPGSSNWGLTMDPVTFEIGEQLFATFFGPNCTTQDGMHSLACGLDVEEIGETDADVESECFVQSFGVSQDETTKIDVKAKFFFTGSYSKSREKVHKIASSESKTYIQTQIGMQLYKIFTKTVSMPLSADFTKSMFDLDKALKNDQPDHYQYLLSDFARSFSATYIRAILVGALLVDDEYVDDTYYEVTDKEVVKRCASASAAFGKFGASAMSNYGVTNEQVETHRNHSSRSTTTAVGGTFFLNTTLEEWQRSAIASPAVIEFTVGDTADFIIPEYHPSLNGANVLRIQRDYLLLQKTYVEQNTHFGCALRNASNFRVWANAPDDSSCVYVNTSGSSFGGFHAQNSFGEDIPNPFNGNNYSCASQFVPRCVQTSNYGYTSTVCVCLSASADDQSGVSFGGSFAPNAPNQITGGQSCPPSYSTLQAPLLSGAAPTTLCVGDTDRNQSMPDYAFGGAFMTDAQNGNCLLANPYTQSCDCPVRAPFLSLLDMRNDRVRYDGGVILNVCYGPVVYKRSDPGQPIPYVDISMIAVRIGKTTKAPLPPLPSHQKPPQESSRSSTTIGILCASGAVFLVVFGGVAVFLAYRRAKRAQARPAREQYEQIN